MIKPSSFRFNIFILLGVFIVLYQPPIVSFNLVHIVGIISLLYIFFHYPRFCNIFRQKFVVDINILLVIIIIDIAFIAILYNKPLVGILGFAYLLLEIIPFCIAIAVYYNKEFTTYTLWNYIILASLIQMLLAISAFLNPEIKRIFQETLISQGISKIEGWWGARRFYGFAANLLFATPVVQGTIAALLLADSRIKTMIRFPLSMLILISGILNARTAIIAFSIGYICLFIKSDIKKKSYYIFSITIIIILFIVYFIPLIKSVAPKSAEWLLAGFNEIRAFFTNESLDESYFNYVAENSIWRVPDSIFGFIFGRGFETIGGAKYGMSSDIGYISDIWQGGLVLLILKMSLFFKMSNRMRKSNREFTSLAGLYFMILMPIVYIKMQSIGNNDFFILISMLYISYVLCNYMEKHI